MFETAKYIAEFKSNLAVAFKHFSTYVAFFASSAAAWWLMQSVETQQSILAAYPALKLAGPAIGFAAFMVAKGLPQDLGKD